MIFIAINQQYRFDIEGHVSTFGHPEWAKTHEPASSTSPVVSTLVQSGATCIGTTVLDNFAYGYVYIFFHKP
jgi:Asp-tRNA(Asn)/Glu-tRNA(Gln) amidotransferase A subunit family amidase